MRFEIRTFCVQFGLGVLTQNLNSKNSHWLGDVISTLQTNVLRGAILQESTQSDNDLEKSVAKVDFKYWIWVSGSQMMANDMPQQQRSSNSAWLKFSSRMLIERSLGLASELVINTLCIRRWSVTKTLIQKYKLNSCIQNCYQNCKGNLMMNMSTARCKIIWVLVQWMYWTDCTKPPLIEGHP